MTWIPVGAASAIAPGDYAQVDVDGVSVAVFNVAGDFYAVEGDVVICPRHGARFCLRTGAVLGPPAYEPIRTFPTRIAGDTVEVQAPD